MKTFKELYKIIENANLEFHKNGRSEIFINYEQEIIAENNPAYLYFFARYVYGGDVKKLQSILLNQRNCFKYGFYFCLYVEGANIVPFLEKSVAEKNAFWVKVYYKLAKDKCISLDDGFKKEIRRICPQIDQRGEFYSIDILLTAAKKEYEKNGRSKRFINMERQVLYSLGEGNMLLFAKQTKGMDINKLTNALILHGNISNMYWALQTLGDIDKQTIYDWSALIKFDCQKINQDVKKRKARNNYFVNELKTAQESGKKNLLRSVLINYRNFLNEWSYYDSVEVTRRAMREYLEKTSVYNFSYDEEENNSIINSRVKKML